MPTLTTPGNTPAPSTTTGEDTVASFDNILGAPRCESTAVSCSSGDLLNGRARLNGGAEPNNGQNTLGPDMCIDGSAGEYHIDQSLDKIVIRSSTSEFLAEGSQATITATVYPVSSEDGTLSYDYADFYYASDASNPMWTYIGTESPNPAIKSAQNLHMTYTLPKGTTQAVRVNFRFLGSRGANKGCSGGPYDDTDDIVFAVKENSGITSNPIGTTSTESPTKKPSDSFCRGYTEICGADKPW
jgi:hypothetical protein